jgi:hypothetical protein
VFERFTERARQVVVLAQEEARTLKHNYIGTEHILLGLIRENEGLAARVLESLGITVERVRAQVVRIVGSGEEVASGQIPFTPRAKKVLDRALREALSLGHNHIGTEHILLGLVRDDEGVAVRILLDLDADSEKIRGQVVRMLSSPRGHPSGEELSVVGGGDPEGAAWTPGPQWDRASVRWNPDGQELVLPLHLEARACLLLTGSPVWTNAALAGVRHEIGQGFVRLSAPGLLETVDPRELRRLLDAAVEQAHEEAQRARASESTLAQAFLDALAEDPTAAPDERAERGSGS